MPTAAADREGVAAQPAAGDSPGKIRSLPVRQPLDARTAPVRSDTGDSRPVQQPDERSRLEREQMLAAYVQNFWRAVEQRRERLEPGDELVVQDQRVAVVEVSDTELILRAAGRNRGVRLDPMPRPLAIALATDWLDSRDPLSLVVLGAFHAVGDERDREQARQLWQEAAARGLDLADLPRVLEPAPALDETGEN